MTKPDISGIAPFFIVKDVAAALAFYRHRLGFAGSPVGGTFAITPDDRRFLMVRDNNWEEMAGTPTLVVVQSFFDELRAKLKR